jgi:hypothetical protein
MPSESQRFLAEPHPTTGLTLEETLKRAPAENRMASSPERVLAEVCALRRAAASGECLQHLTTNCLSKLRHARFALNEIGAMEVAAHVSEAMSGLRRFPQRKEALLLKLERDLNAAGTMLDALIAQYTQSLRDAGSGRAGLVDDAASGQAGD